MNELKILSFDYFDCFIKINQLLIFMCWNRVFAWDSFFYSYSYSDRHLLSD